MHMGMKLLEACVPEPQQRPLDGGNEDVILELTVMTAMMAMTCDDESPGTMAVLMLRVMIA